MLTPKSYLQRTNSRGARQSDRLDPWLQRAGNSTVRQLRGFAKRLRADYGAVRADVVLAWSTGQSEGQVNRPKVPASILVIKSGQEPQRAPETTPDCASSHTSLRAATIRNTLNMRRHLSYISGLVGQDGAAQKVLGCLQWLTWTGVGFEGQRGQDVTWPATLFVGEYGPRGSTLHHRPPGLV